MSNITWSKTGQLVQSKKIHSWLSAIVKERVVLNAAAKKRKRSLLSQVLIIHCTEID